MIITNHVTFDEACASVRTLLRFLGEDVEREGLVDTPQRVVRAWEELVGGRFLDPAAPLEKVFDLQEEGSINGAYKDLVISKNLPFVSFCEHHMLPFEGEAHVAYLPQEGGKVVGLSKLARVVDIYARRFQVQERLTQQICEQIDASLRPRGVVVYIEAVHNCQCMRGIRKKGKMVTVASTGEFRNHREHMRMFLDLVRL